MEQDPQAIQAVKERADKAAEFHSVLTKALTGSPSPLSILRTEIKGFVGEVDRQLRQQTDNEIRQELELVAVDLSEILQEIAGFTEDWARLVPGISEAGGGAGPRFP
jgi:hypothetical protein